MRVAIIVQARMGSERLPGKVMLPIGNKPLIGHLLESLLHCKATSEIIVATTRDPIDDAIVAYCDQQDLVSYRGEESNVASRFYELAASHTWDAFVRVSADSPLLDHQLIDQAISLFGSGPFDLVTNIFPRTFPHGQSVELLRTETFLKDYSQMRTATELEHVTSFFYNHASDYAIHNLTSPREFQSSTNGSGFTPGLGSCKKRSRADATTNLDLFTQGTYTILGARAAVRGRTGSVNKLGAGVIGLGVGAQHADGYARLSGCEVVALCDRSEEKLQSVRSNTVCNSNNSLARSDRRREDTYHSIASSDDAHADQTVAALDAGKNVFVEKPMCRSNGELKQIKKSLARHSHLHLASNLVLRAAPVYGWLRDSIRNGDFGEIYAIDGDYLYGRLHKITDGWRKDVDNYSVMQGGGVHLIDLMLWLTGQRPSDVISQGNRICTRGTAFQQCDFMASTFSFPSGMIGRITANFGCMHRHQHVLRVFGTEGTFYLMTADLGFITRETAIQ